MTAKTVSTVLTCFIAAVWIANGLFCKVLGLVPRHELIVSRILGNDYSGVLTKGIGVAETLMGIWILTGIKTRLNAGMQILVVAVMNILEYILVPDLLLWGRANSIFALLFILVVYYNGFVLYKNADQQTRHV